MFFRTVCFVAALLGGAQAHAQLFRAYLSQAGVDSNPCTLPAPCRLLPAALAAVASGGEIWMLDSANYNSGPVAISKSVTIRSIPGALGSVVATGGSALLVNAAGVTVTLRNLVIGPVPGGGGIHGIHMTAGASLTLEDCVVANLPQAGILVTTAAAVHLFDTTIRDNGSYGVALVDGAKGAIARSIVSGNASHGIYVNGTAAGTTTTADVADTSIDGNNIGVYAWSQHATAIVSVALHDSRAHGNASYAAAAQSNFGASAGLSVSDSILSNNGGGIVANLAGSRVWASGNTVVDNAGVGFANSGGVFDSLGTSTVLRNAGGDVSGTVSVWAAK